MRRAERWIPYLLLAPVFSLLIVFNIMPALAGLREALYAHSLSLTGRRTFVGLENFGRIFKGPVFWKSFRVTLLFSLVVNPFQTSLALGLAVLANQRVQGIRFFRSTYLLPMVISLNITSTIWGLMVNKSGLINGVLAQFGLPGQPFLLAPSQALWTIIGIISWIGVPYWMIFFLAGLQGIPASLLEAAAMDGATAWQRFCHVTLPLLRRVIAFVLVADTIINFFLFAPVWILTRGGPQLSTNLVMYEAYRRGFVWGDLGSSAAMITVLLVITCVFVAVEFAVLRPE